MLSSSSSDPSSSRGQLPSLDRERNINRLQPVCYLIHFDKPYVARTGAQKKRAQHYLGWTINLDKRIKLHACGQGARLLAVVNAEGIGWAVVRLWDNGSFTLEKQLKGRHSHADLCPVCNPRLRNLLPKERMGTTTRTEERAAEPETKAKHIDEGPGNSPALSLFRGVPIEDEG